MTDEQIEKRITNLSGHVNRAADVVADVEAAGDLTVTEAGLIYTGLSAGGSLLEELRAARAELAEALTDCRKLAQLAANEPAFFNPLAAIDAVNRRDFYLREAKRLTETVAS